nr:tyrosine-protein phosphatase [Streptomyces pathocidini]
MIDVVIDTTPRRPNPFTFGSGFDLAGKDRTGWASAALLTALGVDRGAVMTDYLASNVYRKAENEATLAQLPPAQAAVYKPLLDVRAEYLNASSTRSSRPTARSTPT